MLLARRIGELGFTLVEVLVAMALFVAIATGVAQLAAAATRSMRASREHTMAVVLAAAKMDQLLALEWTYEAGDPAIERSDYVTDLSARDLGDGGAGLRASPANALIASAPQFTDYLDDQGRWVGAGTDPPAEAVFIRRWSIRPLTSAPERTLVLQVLVTIAREERSRSGPWRARAGGDVLLTSVRTRKRG